MAGSNKKRGKNKRRKSPKSEAYNADNEIIIGVSTPKREEKTKKKQSARPKRKNKKDTKANKKQTSQYRTSKPRRVVSKEKEIHRLNKRKVVASFVILLMVIIGGGIFLMTTPMFNITTIEVEGNDTLSTETCISLTKIELDSTNLFAVTQTNINKNLKENAYVESATIKRKLPNTIHINIVERKVAYQVEYNKEYIYLDEQGYALEIGAQKKNVVKLTGLSSTKEAINVGDRVNEEDLKKLDTVLKIVNYCKYNLIKNTITQIDVSDASNYTIYFSKDGQTAYLGDASNLSERILNLKTILEKEKGNKGEIFVNGDLSKINGYFRPNEK